MTNASQFNARTMDVVDDEFQSVSEGRIRIRIGMVVYLFVLGLIIVRLAELSLFAAKDYRYQIPDRSKIYRTDIVDRNGELLASSLKTYALFAEPRRVWNPKESALKIASVLPDLDIDGLETKLSSDRAYIQLERGLTPKQKQRVFDLGLPGLKFPEEYKRVYPQGHLASHVVGFTNVDMEGLGGIERTMGERLMTTGAPELALSLDMRVQNAVSDELRRGLKKYEADSNAAVVLDIKTGEVISLVSLPNFDANVPLATSSQTRFNHATMSTYDLGSVFKPLTMAMALEDGVANQREVFPVHKPYRVLDKWIREDHPSDVPLRMSDILAESSNRGTAMIAKRVGAERQQHHLRNLGLLDRVPLELAESARPQVQGRWGEMATVTISYGHGLSVTPLALATATAAMLNDGVYVKPTLLKRSAAHPEQTRRVFSSEVSEAMRHMMRKVVTEGTGRKAAVPGYGVMGKTGTAEKPSRGGYDTDRLVTSFVSAFPHSEPRYVLMVTFDEPKPVEGTYGYATAGWNAAPVSGAIIERIGPMLPASRDVPKMASASRGVFP